MKCIRCEKELEKNSLTHNLKLDVNIKRGVAYLNGENNINPLSLYVCKHCGYIEFNLYK